MALALLHFTDAQRDEQLLPGQEVAKLALTHHASPLSRVSTGGSDGYFVNINLESVKSKLTNSQPFFNSPIKCHFPKETPSSEMAPVPPHHPLCSEYLVVFIQGAYHQRSYLLPLAADTTVPPSAFPAAVVTGLPDLLPCGSGVGTGCSDLFHFKSYLLLDALSLAWGTPGLLPSSASSLSASGAASTSSRGTS